MKGKKGYILKGGTIVSPFKTINNRNILIENGKIKRIYPESINIPNSFEYELIKINKDFYITPGLIDIHTHGGGGEDCIGGDLEIISKDKLKQGITGYVPTFMAAPLDLIFNSFNSIREYKISKKSKNLPRILGIHMEGPYLDRKYRGAQRLDFLKTPNISECLNIIEKSDGLLKIMTLAPELDNCLQIIELLSSYGIISSIGHSNATPADVAKAIDKGANHVTHAFNAMREMSFKEPGVRSPGLECYVLIRDELKLEVIGEFTHMDPSIMEIVFRTKGVNNIILITDSLSVSGLPAGNYKIGVSTLILSKDNPNVARLEDGGLGGSVISLIQAVKNFYESTSATINEAIQIASFNPAKSLGLISKKGSIEIGKDADLVVFDKNFKIKKVFIEGILVFES